MKRILVSALHHFSVVIPAFAGMTNWKDAEMLAMTSTRNTIPALGNR
jgi:hypothetical protein